VYWERFSDILSSERGCGDNWYFCLHHSSHWRVEVTSSVPSGCPEAPPLSGGLKLTLNNSMKLIGI